MYLIGKTEWHQRSGIAEHTPKAKVVLSSDTKEINHTLVERHYAEKRIPKLNLTDTCICFRIFQVSVSTGKDRKTLSVSFGEGGGGGAK